MAQEHVRFNIGHPAPGRGLVGPWRLAFPLLGGPLAWSLELSIGSGLAGIFCTAGGPVRSQTPALTWSEPAAIAVNLLALVVAAVALWVAYSNLQRTGREQEARSGGVMDAGEGRTRFLSVWGVWISVLFFIATCFNTIFLFWGGLCAS